ncbi:ankyrin repeat domain-containing protein [Aspergillus alliaceus]|uniref:ankyrin repeat domain-containing protein n=1 Tax=Petromyces alliaceus TaxID=209559 RepID=UPI0012A4CA8E|nr:ankyrin repeat-containing domain protein [Aspergillus alliaceus]KAB8231758.1 ankyrin repeat-containing domain protein [Aspergillus alliaceus]
MAKRTRQASDVQEDKTKIRLDVEAISAATLQSSHEQTIFKESFTTGMAAVNERIAGSQASQFKQIGSLYNAPPTRTHANMTRSEGMGVRGTPFVVACRSGCPYACHLQQKSTSSALLSRVLGRLFVGYSGLPFFSPKCDFQAWKKSRASQVCIEYWFPLGFLSSSIVRVQVGCQPNIGTLLQLNTLRRVPDTAQCVSYALHGDIEGLKYLFENGLASPRDVSATRGYSVLRWALYGKQYETCNGNNPRNKACYFLLEGGFSDTAVDALRAITKNGYLEDFIDEAGFTKTHKIVLGLSLSSLEDEIILNSDDIKARDAMGHTPLAWAAAQGDHRAVVTLLGHSAYPNIMDVQLSGPLSNAASQGRTVVVRLLLEAGAHTYFPYPNEERKGSPLNCAARNATDVLLLKTLLDFGADVDASVTDGRASLIHAARTDNASFAMLLMEYGADINAISADGSTSLTTAIAYNNHNVLRLILDRWHEYSTCPRLKGPHLLQIAALYAGIETILILEATDHFRKNARQYTLGSSGNNLRQRLDLTDDLAMAFDDLLGVINYVPSQEQRSDGPLKPGILSCFPSHNVDFGGVDHDPNSACSSNESFCDVFERLPLSAEDDAILEKHHLVR